MKKLSKEKKFLKKINSLFEIIKERDFSKILLIICFFYFVLFAGYFLVYGNYRFWDATGHVAFAENIKNNLWPDFSGWNPDFLMGLQQGLSYPPLFHYVLAGLMFILPTNLASNILISLTFIFFPISVYFFSLQMFPKKHMARMATIVILGSWLLVDKMADFGAGTPGVGFNSIVQVGLYPSFFVVPFIFLYAGLLERMVSKNKSVILPSIIFALAILAHFTGVLVAIITIAYLCLITEQRKKVISVFILGALLSAFWWAPYVLDTFRIPPIWFPGYIPTSLIILTVAGFILAFFQKNKMIKVLAICGAFCLGVWANAQVTQLPLQLYRLQPFIIMFMPLSILAILYEKSYNKAGMFFGVLFLLTFILIPPQVVHNPEYSQTIFTKDLNLPGQTLVLMEYDGIPGFHETYVALTEQTLAHSLRGLFVEASPMSEIICKISKYYDEMDFCWGVEGTIQQRVPRDILLKQLNVLNLNYIISSQEKIIRMATSSTVKKIGEKTKYYYTDKDYIFPRNLQSYTETLYLHSLPFSNTVEPVSNVIAKDGLSSKEWKDFATAWFYQSDKTVYVSAKENLDFISDENASVSDYFESPDGQSFSFTINSNRNTPVLIKQTYSPNWNAYDSNNNKLKVYLATPESMLIYSSGKIVFKNQLTNNEIIARVISIATLVFCLIIFIRKRLYEKRI